jgi:hypothetical protein
LLVACYCLLVDRGLISVGADPGGSDEAERTRSSE